MSVPFLYALVGIGLFCLGFHALIVHDHLLRKILAINVMGSGVFLVLVALARRGPLRRSATCSWRTRLQPAWAQPSGAPWPIWRFPTHWPKRRCFWSPAT